MAGHRHCDSDPIECNVEASQGQIDEAIRVLEAFPRGTQQPSHNAAVRAVALLRTVRLDAPNATSGDSHPLAELTRSARLRFAAGHAAVAVEEIDRQRTLGWPDFHPEDYCHRCGGRNISSWYVESDRFNMAFGQVHPYNGIVCPGCFVNAHEQATGLTTTWKLVPTDIHPFRRIEWED